MLNALIIYTLLLSVSLGEGKKFEKCELARELMEVHDASLKDAEKFVCIAEFSSGFDSEYSEETSFGIFNISESACEAETLGGSCNEICSSFIDDDISNDLECVKRLSISVPRCRGENEKYLDDCRLTSSQETTEDLNEMKPDEENNGKLEQVPEDRDYYDIDGISGTDNLNLQQMRLIRELVKKNPRQEKNVKYIFVFV
jgi:hypothetical protein